MRCKSKDKIIVIKLMFALILVLSVIDILIVRYNIKEDYDKAETIEQLKNQVVSLEEKLVEHQDYLDSLTYFKEYTIPKVPKGIDSPYVDLSKCNSISDCMSNMSLEGCSKDTDDCNVCCYNTCTLMYCMTEEEADDLIKLMGER